MNGYEYAVQYAKFILLGYNLAKYCSTEYDIVFYIITKMDFSDQTGY